MAWSFCFPNRAERRAWKSELRRSGDHFGQVVVVDFEYEIAPGGLPNPLCMVAIILDENFQYVRTIRMWRGEFGRTPPFDIGPDTLVVAYSAWAEMRCFLVLGWRFPAHICDAHTAYLARTNLLLPYAPDEVRKKQRKRLSDACRFYGIEGWQDIDKEEISQAIADGSWIWKYSPEEILAYCAEDVIMTVKLLHRLLLDRRCANITYICYWSDYSAKCIARIQARGKPIDVALWNLVQENKAAVVRALIRQFDPSQSSPYPIYTPEGEWSYERFERWLAYLQSQGLLTGWPRLDSGRLDLSSDAFGIMSHVPGIDELHALRDCLSFIVKARLPIGPDGRNRPSLFPFGAASSRNAHARSLYNTHAAARSFMKFPPETIGFYLDWRTQEIGIAAAHSGDAVLIADYLSGDVYHALARMCGLTDEPDIHRWKATQREQRERMKALQLGINYGMGVPSLSRGLDRHPCVASEVIERYKRRCSIFWQWRINKMQAAMLEREIRSIDGWPLYITTSPNQRTLYNFPMQSGGVAMLRRAVIRLCEADIVPIMLIHDGILFEETDPEKLEHAMEIMRAAGRETCNGLEIGVDIDQKLIGGARYRDKRPMAQKMWATIMNVLKEIGALSDVA
jgi:DNA polymerase-1